VHRFSRLELGQDYQTKTLAALLPLALRSRVRRLVLGIFIRAPKTMFSLSEISRDANLANNEVIGALRGVKGEYTPELSLLSLGLVKEVMLKVSESRSRRVYILNDEREIPLEQIEHILRRYRRVGEE
jgi:predicted transcriptional regulator with HTH domain